MIRHLALLIAGATTALSAQKPAVWTVTEELRIGGDSGPYVFENVQGIAPTRAGNLLVLDYKAREIRVFDSAGKFLRLAARRGHGPGEIENATGLALAPDGTVWTTDPANGRFSIYGPDGRYIRQVLNKPFAWSSPWGAVFDDKGRLVEKFPLPKGDGVHLHYRRLYADGHTDTLNAPPCPSHYKRAKDFVGMSADGTPGFFRAVPFQPMTLVTLDRRGTVWCAPTNEYVIYNSSLDTQDTIAVARSSAAHPPVTAAERAAIIAQIDSQMAKFPKRDVDYSRIPATKPPIAGIFTDDASRLWVQQPSAPGSRTTEFDVWDTSGRQVAVVRVPFRLKIDLLPPVVVGNLMYAIALDDDDVQYIVRARLRP